MPNSGSWLRNLQKLQFRTTANMQTVSSMRSRIFPLLAHQPGIRSLSGFSSRASNRILRNKLRREPAVSDYSPSVTTIRGGANI
jgi:hypothetical protein